jgi:hypothetical protein
MTMRQTRKAALFDLDNTLTDHASAFAAWATEFADSSDIPLPWLMRAETLHAGARHAFFADLKDTFKIQRSIASLHSEAGTSGTRRSPSRPSSTVTARRHSTRLHDWRSPSAKGPMP